MNLYSNIAALKAAYLSGEVSVEAYLQDCLSQIKADKHNAWISYIDSHQLNTYLSYLNEIDMSLPLWGVPFAVKDNIDLEGLETTAACKEFSHYPKTSAYAVQKLIKAGAIPLGKTNLDQFATGLVGVRSPYGACKNSINDKYVSGGSSSGSAVSVALGQVMFSLGTDTAGSGRVPAAFNNILGLKGTCGAVSCSGVVPACKSLDCVTVFATCTDDLSTVFSVVKSFDSKDCYSRQSPKIVSNFPRQFTFGVPKAENLEFFKDKEAKSLFETAVESLKSIGGTPKTINLQPFLDAAKLLYEGSFVTERLAGNYDFFTNHLDDCLDVIQNIIGGSKKFTAVDAYSNNYKLMEYKRLAYAQLDGVDFVITPTTGTIYKIKEVQNDPIALNSNLGYYTNFMNLLDFCAIALPLGFRTKGNLKDLPFGITLFSKAFNDEALINIGSKYLNYCKFPVGANKLTYCDNHEKRLQNKFMNIVVCGAHLDGLPLNYQLLERGAKLVKRTTTASKYRMYKVSDEGGIIKPGLIRDETSTFSFDVEVYAMPIENVGSFLSLIPYPLGLGNVELEDGTWSAGFICEGEAIEGAEDISSYGGFKAYLESL